MAWRLAGIPQPNYDILPDFNRDRSAILNSPSPLVWPVIRAFPTRASLRSQGRSPDFQIYDGGGLRQDLEMRAPLSHDRSQPEALDGR
jgi:hypothetical protein